MTGAAEQLYQLRKTMGVSASPLHSFHINPQYYRSVLFICAWGLEKVLEAAFTGTSTRSGELLTLHAKATAGPLTADAAPLGKVYVTMCADAIMEISACGVTVFDQL